jgi:hypothetical protein
MSNLVLFLFKSIFFKSLLFFKFIFSSLSLIILIGWKFYIIIFSGLPFMSWSSFMTHVTGSECWTGLAPIVFDYFLELYPSSLSSLQIGILYFFFFSFGFFYEFDFSFQFFLLVQYLMIFKV